MVKKNSLSKSKLDITLEFTHALESMSSAKKCVFITGKAGTGKSTLLKHFYDQCAKDKKMKEPVILAPTGVAALNVKGQTIHKFFNFYIDITPQKIRDKEFKPKKKKIFKKLQTIIIDEISMVRADLLDCIDEFLRLYGPLPGQPFGGVHMIFIGDLYQLPPVVNNKDRAVFESYYDTPYFYSANVFSQIDIEIIELSKVYRQREQEFIDLLNAVRNNSVTDEDMVLLNQRYLPSQDEDIIDKNHYITLTSTNKKADEINAVHLEALSGKEQASIGELTGNFTREYLPTSVELEFKVGAQIMMINNDLYKRWVNGSIGTIEACNKDREGKEYVKITLHDSGEVAFVYKHTWEVFNFIVKDDELVAEPAGSFTQYPFRLAWAVTIHKSQGKTFDNVVIDIGRGTFASGQMYVALSRCTSFNGIILKTEIKKRHILVDERIFKFLTGYQYKIANKELSVEEKVDIIKDSIKNKSQLKIMYLKANDSKYSRVIKPLTLELYNGANADFYGLEAFCVERQEVRRFRVERILDIEL